MQQIVWVSLLWTFSEFLNILRNLIYQFTTCKGKKYPFVPTGKRQRLLSAHRIKSSVAHVQPLGWKWEYKTTDKSTSPSLTRKVSFLGVLEVQNVWCVDSNASIVDRTTETATSAIFSSQDKLNEKILVCTQVKSFSPALQPWCLLVVMLSMEPFELILRESRHTLKLTKRKLCCIPH